MSICSQSEQLQLTGFVEESGDLRRYKADTTQIPELSGATATSPEAPDQSTGRIVTQNRFGETIRHQQRPIGGNEQGQGVPNVMLLRLLQHEAVKENQIRATILGNGPTTERGQQARDQQGGTHPRCLYFGCGTMRMYGSGASQPSGYFSRAASLDTAGRMITSSPSSQLAGVATCCAAVN